MDVNSKLTLQAKRKSLTEDDKSKKKSRKYSDTYLNFGFQFILQNGEKNLSALFATRYWPVRACCQINLNHI